MIPDDLSELLTRCGQLIADADWRPQPSPAILRDWDANIEAWIADGKVPLFVCRSSLPRGTVITHETGRPLVPTDNIPAHWVFAQAVAGRTQHIKQNAKQNGVRPLFFPDPYSFHEQKCVPRDKDKGGKSPDKCSD